VLPIGAAALVVWLGWNALSARGPTITISFREAQGLLPGQTRIQHRSVVVGTVESMELTSDMSRVLVRARMTRAAIPYLTDATRFYIVVPRVGIGGISGLSTIVSGVYIEMYPDRSGESRREFVGLDVPPQLAPDVPGTSFALRTSDLGSVTAGAPVTYNGVNVGEVQGYALAEDGQFVSLTAFVRAPYDRLVHPESHFWNVSGLEVSVGAQGVHLRAGSLQELLVGGIAFETPTEVLWNAPSHAGEEFSLYANREEALRALKEPGLVYRADFAGNIRGIGLRSPVELQGMEVGEVLQSHLRYDNTRHALVTAVTFSIDPGKVQIQDMPASAAGGREKLVNDWLVQLVRRGLRAQVSEVSLLTGSKLVALDMITDMPPGRLGRAGGIATLPTAPSGDLSELLTRARVLVSNLGRATSGPEIRNALVSLDHTLARLDTLTRSAAPDVQALVTGLRQAADAATGTLGTVQVLMGRGVPGDSDLPRLLDEVSLAARSVRELADYLDQHPEALLRGRGKGSP
jgi:paraquat-inducible protein B